MATPPLSTAHLVRRVTYGATPDLVATVDRAGQRAWLAAQLNPQAVPDGKCTSLLRRFPSLGWSIGKVRAQVETGLTGDWDVMYDLVRAALARAAWSNRQVLEVMVDLWSNHLNITCPSSDVWDSRAHYDANAIRPHALGRFSDLLVAATTHPAMLRYLDSATSTKTHPNENHGRELLELHTVGLGYTEDDVANSARILTGLSVDNVTGLGVYRPGRHHVGPVRVLDFRHPNARADGRGVVEAYLRHLAAHPSTATRIARKLAVRFVGDAPSPALVADLAATYTRHGTAIVPVLLRLFASAEFAASTGQKVRRPFEDLVATIRTLNLGPDPRGVEGITALGWMIQDLGHAPYGWAPPDGYPDVADAWRSTAGTLGRWNMHLSLAANWWPKGLARPAPSGYLPATLPATHGALVDALAVRLLGTRLDAARRAAVCTFLDADPATPLRAKSPAVGWRLPYAMALILDSPDHAAR